MSNFKFPANTKISVSSGYFAIKGNDDFEFYSEDINTDILDLSPIETYGATDSRGSIACYNMATSSVTLGDIIAAKESITLTNMHHDVNRVNYITDGFLYDSEDETYTPFHELDEDFQENIISSGGDYQTEDESGYDHFIPTYQIGEEWITFLTYAIDKLTPLIEVESDEDD